MALIALVVALLALAAVAYLGWQWWQGRTVGRHVEAHVTQLRGRVGDLGKQMQTMQRSVHSDAKQREDDARKQQALKATNRRLRGEVDSLSERVQSLEHAVHALLRSHRRGRDAIAMQQAAMLLRMGQQRYELFHDAGGAMHALGLADQVLAASGDPSVAGVRQSLDAERKALAATHPGRRDADLAALARLRARVMDLPLKPHAQPAEGRAEGFWHRVWQALSTAVVIRRTDASARELADTRLARELTALDVAAAEAARLAWRPRDSHAALQRVARALATRFDTRDARVRKAQAQVERLLAEKPTSRPPLGKALRELEDLRGVREAAAGAAHAATIPAPAASSAAPAPAGTSS